MSTSLSPWNLRRNRKFCHFCFQTGECIKTFGGHELAVNCLQVLVVSASTIDLKPVFHLANLFARTENKAT